MDGLTYKVSGSHDLPDFDEGLVEIAPPPDPDLPPLSDGWSYRTFRMSLSVAELPSGFIRVATAPSSVEPLKLLPFVATLLPSQGLAGGAVSG